MTIIVCIDIDLFTFIDNTYLFYRLDSLIPLMVAALDICQHMLRIECRISQDIYQQ